MHIIHVSPQVAPFSSNGSLGEIVGALPTAQQEAGNQVTVIAPLSKDIVPERYGLARRITTVAVPLGDEELKVGMVEGKFVSSDVSVIFVDHPPTFQQDQDDLCRSYVLCAAALRIMAETSLEVELIHAHGWQTGLLPLLLKQEAFALSGQERPLVAFTVHDPANAGLFPSAEVDKLGLNSGDIQVDGQASMLKAGVDLADRVILCSPTASRDVLTEAFGLHALYSAIQDKLHGVLPGVDPMAYNPAVDHHLAAHYQADHLKGKEVCKASLQEDLGLSSKEGAPLLAVLGRLNPEGGMDRLLEALPELPLDMLQVAFLGEAEPAVAQKLEELVGQHPGSIFFRPGEADLETIHRILAGADALLIPTPYDPGGLLQLKALRYGTPPMVSNAGGSLDAVVDFDPPTGTGTGLHFLPAGESSVGEVVSRFLQIYWDPKQMETLQRNAMTQDFSWERSARRHRMIYASDDQ